MPEYRTLLKRITNGAPPNRRYYFARYKLFRDETMAPCEMRRMDGWRMVDPKDPLFAERFGKELKGDDFTPGKIRLDASNRVIIGDLVLMETSIENYKRRRQESIDNANLPLKRLAEGGHIPDKHVARERPPILETKLDDMPTRSHTPAASDQ